MTLGLPKTKPVIAKRVDPAALNARIAEKINRLKRGINMPAAIHQLETTLPESLEQRVIEFFSKYMPESKEAKEARLRLPDPNAGPKPVIVKFGMKHITELVCQQKPRLVVLAADVTPVTVHFWLPALCHLMKVPYAIVKSQSTLGKLVRMKRTVAVALEGCHAEDEKAFASLIGDCNAIFIEQYDTHKEKLGGRAALKQMVQ